MKKANELFGLWKKSAKITLRFLEWDEWFHICLMYASTKAAASFAISHDFCFLELIKIRGFS